MKAHGPCRFHAPPTAHRANTNVFSVISVASVVKVAAVVAATAGLTIAAASLTAQQKPKNVRDGVFTADQALRGKSGYDGVCARCHGVPLTGSQGNGPALKGPAFLAHWDKDTLGSLYTKIRDTMPQGNPARSPTK